MDLSRVPHLRPAPPRAVPDRTDPDFVRASEWLARAPREPSLWLVGVPFNGGSLSRARCDLTPAAFRRALDRFSVWSSDHAVSIERVAARDAGDVDCAEDVEKAQAQIAEAVSTLVALAPAPVVVVGGDNSITVGAARGADADALITFDAHHDCRDPSRGATNGSPVRQLVEGGIGGVVQIGIHGFANAEPHARWALDHKIHVVEAARAREQGIARTADGALRLVAGAARIWIDFDLDVLDRAFAPGTAAALPGGLAPGDLQEAAFLLGRDPRVVGIDITEVDPETDVADTTVRAACGVVLAYCAGVASR